MPREPLPRAPALTPDRIRAEAGRIGIALVPARLAGANGGTVALNENALYGGPVEAEAHPLYHMVVMAPLFEIAKAPESGRPLILSFRPHPQQIELTEPAAVDIQALQDGGRYVEHQGDALGDLVIAGTTGVFLPALAPPAGPLAEPPMPVTASASAERAAFHSPRFSTTGFDRIVELRTFFRLYFDLKKGRTTSENVAKPSDCYVTWLNLKDGEWWIVEPLAFRVPRSVDFRTGYRYEIQCKVLRRIDPSLLSDVLRAGVFRDEVVASTARAPRAAGLLDRIGGMADRFRSGVDAVTARVNAVNQDLQRVQEVVNQFVEAGGSIQNLISTAFGVAQNTIGLTLGNVVDFAGQAMDLVHGVAQGATAVVTVPLHDLQALASFADAFVRSLEELGSGTQITAAWSELEDAWRRLARSSKGLANGVRVAGTSDSTDPLVSTARKLDAARDVDQDLAAAPPMAGLMQVVVLAGESIRDLALRVLGDELRWKEIVVINDLVPPYVTPLGGPGVLAEGGFALVPTGSRTIEAAPAPDAAGRTPLAVRLYGTDLKLALGAGAGTIEVAEVEIVREERPGGERVFDLALVSGVPNLVQALQLKGSTQPGELRLHPEYGFALPVGVRLSPLLIFFAKFQALRTLVADDRIASVQDVALVARGDVARMDVKVAAAGSGQLLAT